MASSEAAPARRQPCGHIALEHCRRGRQEGAVEVPKLVTEADAEVGAGPQTCAEA